MQKKGFGIIGSGAVASIHAQAINALESANLVGIFSLDAAEAEILAESSSCRIYNTLEEMGADKEIDFVSICTPSGAHMEPAVFMAQKHKNLIIEKPLEVTLKRCDRIIQAAKENNVLLSGIFQTRFHPSAIKLKKAVEENRFGKISLASAYVKWFRDQDYYDSSSWRGTWRMDGGGAVMNQAIHAVDLLRWLIGPVESVKAFGSTISHKGIEVEDTLTGIFKFKNGVLGSLEASTGAWPGAFKKIEICGDKGHAILEEDKLVVWEFVDTAYESQNNSNDSTGDNIIGRVKDPVNIGYYAHMKQIEDCILADHTGKSPSIDGSTARAAVELVIQLYESAGLINQ